MKFGQISTSGFGGDVVERLWTDGHPDDDNDDDNDADDDDDGR